MEVGSSPITIPSGVVCAVAVGQTIISGTCTCPTLAPTAKGGSVSCFSPSPTATPTSVGAPTPTPTLAPIATPTPTPLMMPVAQWNDLSGNGETLVQSNIGNQPTYVTNCVNGLPCVSFNGSSSYLVSGDNSFSRLLYPASTVFVVQHSNTANSNNSATIFAGNAGSGSRYNLAIPGVAFDFGVCCSGPQRIYNTSVSAQNAHVWTAIGGVAANKQQLNEDGASIASGTPLSTPTTFNCSMSVGGIQSSCAAGVNDGFWLSGSIEEILIYDVTLSQTNYQYVEGYVACKWGLQGNLPSGHPYKSSCPSGIPATSGIPGLSAWYDASNSGSIVGLGGVHPGAAGTASTKITISERVLHSHR